MPEESGSLVRVMTGRDPSEAHRSSTPLELLFDLCFVVAVSQAAGQLHHAMSGGHVGLSLLGYPMVFFAIWWAWMNFTWFASAYDTDDAPYRVLTLVQMAGVLVLAAGVPAAFEHRDFTAITVGYVIMRIALVGQWLRAAVQHHDGRPAALRYAVGITVVQIGWVLRLLLPEPYSDIGFAVLAIAELAVPAWAESRNRPTPWHPGHIADRYGEFTIIVFGEVILANGVAVQQALSNYGLSVPLVLIAVGGLVAVFALWWLYFSANDTAPPSLRTALIWGYGHYLVFGAAAALGAGLQVAVDTTVHHSEPSPVATFAVAVPIALMLVLVAALHRMVRRRSRASAWPATAGAVAVLAVTELTSRVLSVAGVVTAVGVIAAAVLATTLLVDRRGGQGLAGPRFKDE